MVKENQIIVPFLKWAGGKRWLVSAVPDIFPKSFTRYVEPFLGSGAIFFHLQPSRALLADRNKELIDTYVAIKTDWQKVSFALRGHQQKHSRAYYYFVRNQQPRTLWSRAARFIYLNRTCWNGLFRVNLAGQFNVPIGTKSNVLLTTDDFWGTSNLLKKARLVSADFEAIINKAKRGDFLFVDPPYTVKHNHNGFVKYNEDIFSWGDQERLAVALKSAGSRGVKFLMTNADHRSIRNLYRPHFNIQSLSRASVLAADSSKRAAVSELLVNNY